MHLTLSRKKIKNVARESDINNSELKTARLE
ncbi:hypothetical protein [Escherichia phage FL37]